MLTANSSAVVLQFEPQQPDTRKGFVQASREWLHERNTDPRLKDRHKAFCACIFNYFNYEHYEKTDELKAWPSWKTMTVELGWSESKISRVSNDVEATGALEIERSYNKQTKKKNANRYKARMTYLSKLQGSGTDQPVNSTRHLPVNLSQKLPCNSASVTSDSRTSESEEKENLRKRNFDFEIQQASKESAKKATSASEAIKPAATPPTLPSLKPPPPQVPRAPLPPNAALIGAARPSPAEGRVVMPGDDLDWFEDWCLATGRSFFQKDAKGCIRVPDDLWLQHLQWKNLPAHERGLGSDMTVPIGPPGDSLADFVP